MLVQFSQDLFRFTMVWMKPSEWIKTFFHFSYVYKTENFHQIFDGIFSFIVKIKNYSNRCTVRIEWKKTLNQCVLKILSTFIMLNFFNFRLFSGSDLMFSFFSVWNYALCQISLDACKNTRLILEKIIGFEGETPKYVWQLVDFPTTSINCIKVMFFHSFHTIFFRE